MNERLLLVRDRRPPYAISMTPTPTTPTQILHSCFSSSTWGDALSACKKISDLGLTCENRRNYLGKNKLKSLLSN